jgi:hypothetical protein
VRFAFKPENWAVVEGSEGGECGTKVAVESSQDAVILDSVNNFPRTGGQSVRIVKLRGWMVV